MLLINNFRMKARDWSTTSKNYKVNYELHQQFNKDSNITQKKGEFILCASKKFYETAYNINIISNTRNSPILVPLQQKTISIKDFEKKLNIWCKDLCNLAKPNNKIIKKLKITEIKY